jgi:hypothetical protein
MSKVNVPSQDARSCRLALERDGWMLSETAFTDRAGRLTWIAVVEKDERRVRSEGATRDGAWWGVWYRVVMGWEP